MEGITAEPTNTSDPTNIPPVFQVNCQRPSKAVIGRAIYGKASDPDKIPAETIKADTETSTDMLHNLIGKIYMGQRKNTKEGYLVKLPQKGDLQECKNY